MISIKKDIGNILKQFFTKYMASKHTLRAALALCSPGGTAILENGTSIEYLIECKS